MLKISRVSKIVFPLLIILLGFQGILGEFFYLNQEKLDIRSFLNVLITAAALFALFVIAEKVVPLLRRWRVQKLVRKVFADRGYTEPMIEEPLEVVVNISEQYLQENLREKVVEYTQPFIENLIETNDFLGYIVAGGSGLTVPKRAFQTEEEQTKFKELLENLLIKE